MYNKYQNSNLMNVVVIKFKLDFVNVIVNMFWVRGLWFFFNYIKIIVVQREI